MKTAFRSLLHLFFPHTCAGCGSDILDHDQLLCLQCADRLPQTGFHRYAGNPVEKIFWGRLKISCATSFLYFTKSSLLQHLVHQFKYNGKKEIGEFIGRRMGDVMTEASRFGTIDALVPLPLYAARERRRGYNQAGVLCDAMAEVLKVPVLKMSSSGRRPPKHKRAKAARSDGQIWPAALNCCSPKPCAANMWCWWMM